MHSFSTAFNNIPKADDFPRSFSFNSTERGKTKTIMDLKRHPVAPNSVALITSGLFGLSAAYFQGLSLKPQLKIKYILSIDYSPVAAIFWKVVGALLRSQENRYDFILHLFKDLRILSARFSLGGENDKSILSIFQEIRRKRSFLSTDEGYKWARKIFLRNRFCHIQGDFCNPKMTAHLAKVVKSKGLHFDLLYLSSITDDASLEGDLNLYLKALKKLKQVTTKKTIIIDSQHSGTSLLFDKKIKLRMTQNFQSLSLKKHFIPSPIQFIADFSSIDEIKGPVYPSISSFNYSVHSKDLKKIINDAAKEPVREGMTTLLFYGDFFALNLVWERGRLSQSPHKIDRIVLFNSNLGDTLLWHKIAELLMIAPSRNIFIEQLNPLIPFHVAARIKIEMSEKIGWLASDESFSYVQGIFKRYQFVKYYQDPFHLKSLQTIIAGIAQNGSRLDTLYLFDLPLEAKKRQVQEAYKAFLETLKPIMTKYTWYVDIYLEDGYHYAFKRKPTSIEVSSFESYFQVSFSSCAISQKPIKDDLVLCPLEWNREEVLSQIGQLPIKNGARTILFQKGLFPLEIASLKRGDHTAKHLIAVDDSITSATFWAHFSSLIKVTQTSEEFISAFLSLLNNPELDFFPQDPHKKETTISHFLQWIKDNKTFLTNEGAYQFIRAIFVRGDFLFLKADLTNPNVAKAIVFGLKENYQLLDTISLSTLQEKAEAENRLSDFHNSMKILKKGSHASTIAVDSKYDLEMNRYKFRKTTSFLSCIIEAHFHKVISTSSYEK